MIKRETVMTHRRVVNKMDYTPTKETVRMLCDGALELLDAVEGGPDVQAQRADLKQRERQVALALTDLRVMLADIQINVPADLNPAVVDGVPLLTDLARTIFTIDLIEEMLKAKGPKWKNEWSWYAPRISEEFEDATN